MNKIEQYIRFIQEAERLKSVLRTAWTSQGRQESTAEHTWRLAMLASLVLEDYPDLDGKKVLQMCLIHDMGELYDGDISAALRPDQAEKYEEESAAVNHVLALLPEPQKTELRTLWEEYNDNLTEEAHLVKALDKAETIIQHNQGRNPESFDYGFNLEYGASYFQADAFLKEMREQIDTETREHIEEGNANGKKK